MTDIPLTPPPGASFNPAEAVPARTYAALRGADKEAFASDREAVDELKRAIHDKVDEVAQENAAALVRVVRHLARRGYTQFADLGCGKPVQGMDALGLPDLYDAAAGIKPDVKWLALDSDQVVVTTCRALLRGPGVSVVQQDLRQSAKVLDAMSAHLWLGKPVVVILGAVLHFLTDEQCTDLRFALRARLAPRSVVVGTHVTGDGMDPQAVERGRAAYAELHGGVPIYVRSERQVLDLVRDFAIKDPGVVRTIDFMPEEGGRTPLRDAPHFLMVMAERKDK
ncbi:SAM-dependent methyltransferase [Nonomuraea candida]|uniref:SAM-dependent methyltransferase n=1 Tax=Nonomuraea candida TaxID=359159 RepID=UPI0005BC9FB4|nr:SAM-dependent methyltransferase [Nonomuraea candida]